MSDFVRKSDVVQILKECNLDEKLFEKDVFNKINNLPTAYDADKVVQELEENSSRYTKKYTTPYGNNGYRDTKAISIHKAIEIVKQGGVGTETETIRDKAVKWNNNSSKKVPYEFIDYVEEKRYIGVSDDVCEWINQYKTYGWKPSCETNSVYNIAEIIWFKYCPFCGKKIKVVE